jgi:hypothetical protein
MDLKLADLPMFVYDPEDAASVAVAVQATRNFTPAFAVKRNCVPGGGSSYHTRSQLLFGAGARDIALAAIARVTDEPPRYTYLTSTSCDPAVQIIRTSIMSKAFTVRDMPGSVSTFINDNNGILHGPAAQSAAMGRARELECECLSAVLPRGYEYMFIGDCDNADDIARGKRILASPLANSIFVWLFNTRIAALHPVRGPKNGICAAIRSRNKASNDGMDAALDAVLAHTSAAAAVSAAVSAAATVATASPIEFIQWGQRALLEELGGGVGPRFCFYLRPGEFDKNEALRARVSRLPAEWRMLIAFVEPAAHSKPGEYLDMYSRGFVEPSMSRAGILDLIEWTPAKPLPAEYLLVMQEKDVANGRSARVNVAAEGNAMTTLMRINALPLKFRRLFKVTFDREDADVGSGFVSTGGLLDFYAWTP